MDVSGISGMNNQLVNSLANADSANKLKDKLNSTSKSDSTDAELMEVCKEFEAYFMEQIYKKMLDTVPTSEYSSQGTQTLMDYYKDEFVRQVSKQTVDQSQTQGEGGNTLAQMLYEQMKRNYEV